MRSGNLEKRRGEETRGEERGGNSGNEIGEIDETGTSRQGNGAEMR